MSPEHVTHRTSGSSSSVSNEQAEQKGREAIEIAGQIGYATKGLVYVVVGGLAVSAAWGAGGQTTGSKGAISEIGSQPWGEIALWFIAIGLAAYCIWRIVEAITDPDHEGTDAKGIGKRLGYAASGIGYGVLAWTAAPFSSSSGSSGSKQSYIAELLALPAGPWIVGALGIGVVAYGGYQIYKGFAHKFMDKYDASQMKEKEQKLARISGKFGLAARGVTFGVIGFFIVVAAVNLNPERVKGLGEALDVLARQTYGAWILLAVAIGLFLYGVFCLVQARYRRFRVG